jgi:RNA polymerase sigma-70 factor (ECF subfamily)
LETDESLVIRARTGDRDAFCLLVTRYERPVLALAAGLLGSSDEAQDVAQDAFLTSYRKLNCLTHARKFGPWVFQIARRAALRVRKQRNRRKHTSIDPDLPDPRRDSANPGEQAMSLIARLPRHEQVVLSLRYLDGLTTAEISRATGRPVGTVTKQLSRALRRLERQLKDTNHE